MGGTSPVLQSVTSFHICRVEPLGLLSESDGETSRVYMNLHHHSHQKYAFFLNVPE